MDLGGEVFGVALGELVRWSMTLAFAIAIWMVEARTRHMPNALTLGGLVPAVIVAVLFGRGLEALVGGAFAFVAAYMAFRDGTIGGGAVKAALLLGVSGGAAVGLTLGLAAALGAAVTWWLSRGSEDDRDGRSTTFGPFRTGPMLLGLSSVGLALSAVAPHW